MDSSFLHEQDCVGRKADEVMVAWARKQLADSGQAVPSSQHFMLAQYAHNIVRSVSHRFAACSLAARSFSAVSASVVAAASPSVALGSDWNSGSCSDSGSGVAQLQDTACISKAPKDCFYKRKDKASLTEFLHSNDTDVEMNPTLPPPPQCLKPVACWSLAPSAFKQVMNADACDACAAWAMHEDFFPEMALLNVNANTATAIAAPCDALVSLDCFSAVVSI